MPGGGEARFCCCPSAIKAILYVNHSTQSEKKGTGAQCERRKLVRAIGSGVEEGGRASWLRAGSRGSFAWDYIFLHEKRSELWCQGWSSRPGVRDTRAGRRETWFTLSDPYQCHALWNSRRIYRTVSFYWRTYTGELSLNNVVRCTAFFFYAWCPCFSKVPLALLSPRHL